MTLSSFYQLINVNLTMWYILAFKCYPNTVQFSQLSQSCVNVKLYVYVFKFITNMNSNTIIVCGEKKSL